MSRKRTEGKALKIFCAVVSCLLAVVILLVCLQVWSPVNPLGWLAKSDTKTEQGNGGDQTGQTEGDHVTLSGGGMILTPIEDEESLVSLYSVELPVAAYAANDVPETAESSFIVTATVEPDNYATNSTIEWSADWEGGRWINAQGHYENLDEYVQITTQGDDYISSKTLTVTCLQSFGEPIILTATCKYDKTLTASIKLDYAARLNLYRYEPMNSRDAEGTYHNFTWGDIEIPFELGTARASTIVNFYPQFMEFMAEGYSTINEDYTITLKHVSNNFEGITVGGYSFSSFGTKTAELGTLTVSKRTGGNATRGSFSPNPHGEEQFFRFGASGIGQTWTGYYGGNQNYNSTMYDICCYKSGESLYYEVESFNEKIELNKNASGRFHFSDIVLEIKSDRVLYTKTASIYITKALSSVVLSGVSIEGGDVIL